jgi:hypothetical protein
MYVGVDFFFPSAPRVVACVRMAGTGVNCCKAARALLGGAVASGYAPGDATCESNLAEVPREIFYLVSGQGSSPCCSAHGRGQAEQGALNCMESVEEQLAWRMAGGRVATERLAGATAGRAARPHGLFALKIGQ